MLCNCPRSSDNRLGIKGEEAMDTLPQSGGQDEDNHCSRPSRRRGSGNFLDSDLINFCEK